MAKSNNNYKPIVILNLLIVGWIAGLLIESSQPPLALLGQVQGLDKVAHFLAFSGLGLLVCALSFKLSPKLTIPLFSMPLLIVTLSGIIEESYQIYIPGRAASLLDLLADVCGAVCAVLLANRVAYIIRANNGISAE
jgi:hypothetical protein